MLVMKMVAWQGAYFQSTKTVVHLEIRIMDLFTRLQSTLALPFGRMGMDVGLQVFMSLDQSISID